MFSTSSLALNADMAIASKERKKQFGKSLDKHPIDDDTTNHY
jgi:hypothetical protein